MNKEEKEFFYSIGRGSLNLNGKFYYGLDYSITDFMNSLEQENKKYKEVIDKLKMRISARIKKYQQKIDNEINMGSQGDYFKICRYEENIKFLKDILKEVE